MLYLLLLASVSMVFAAEAEVKAEIKPETKEELKPEESVLRHDDRYSFNDGLELIRHRDERFHDDRQRILDDRDRRYQDDRQPLGLDEHDLPGPVILRTPGPLPNQGHPDIEAQNKIIANVFSPDYYQPTWVLDYRYLKSGGRDYTRGPGGQILILPKGVRSKEPKEFPDYDALLEHLRLSRLSEQQHHRRDDHERDNWQYAQGQRGYQGHGHGQTAWHKYG